MLDGMMHKTVNIVGGGVAKVIVIGVKAVVKNFFYRILSSNFWWRHRDYVNDN